MLKGFICPRDGKNKDYSYCWTICSDTCMPLPVLLAVSKQMREVEEDVYHVTEILNPPQQVWLQRNKDYYVPPDSLIDMNIGTSWHEKLEQTKKYIKELGLQKEYIMEKNFKVPYWWDKSGEELITKDEVGVAPHKDVELNSIILSGTPDLYVTPTTTLWDYKVTKYYYTLKYMLEDKWEDNTYAWQLNIYRHFNYRDAQMKLFCYVKDWKTNFPARFKVNKTMIIKVPRIADRIIEERVKALLAEHVANQRDSSKIRQCEEKERWINSEGVPMRCEYFCGVSRICKQYGTGRIK